MKIVQINTYDIQGGAARAAYRLHQGLIQVGQESTMLSRYKVSSDETVKQVYIRSSQSDYRETSLVAIQAHYINANRTYLSNTLFSLPYPGYDLSQRSEIADADVINLHWVALSQSPITLQKLFALGKPIVWTLHDMWAFTGGCHYSAGCYKYTKDCSNCPQLAHDPCNLAAAILEDKLKCLAEANLTIVTPSQWLAHCAKSSQLFKDKRVDVIPYGLEADVFVPSPKQQAKQAIGIHPDTITLLFGAGNGDEARKGFVELIQAIQYCLNHSEFRQLISGTKLELLCFGYPSSLLKALAVPVRSLGNIESDQQLSEVYSAADVFILPSLEDNLPNTMLEAMSCGTPVIGFDTGGIPDLIKDGVTGRLVPLGDTHQLAKAILDTIFQADRREQMGQACRSVIEAGYTMSIQAERYLALYRELHDKRQQFVRIAATAKPSANEVNHGDSSMSDIKPDVLPASIEMSLGTGFDRVFDRVAVKSVVIELQQTQAQLERTQAQLEQTQAQLEQTQADSQYAQAKLGEQLQQAQQSSTTLEADLVREQHLVHRLKEQLQSVEVVRSRLNNEMYQVNQYLRHQIKQLNQANRKLTRQNKQISRSVHQLEQEVANLSTGKAALRQLFKTSLRKLKLYDFVYQRHDRFVPVYNLLFRDRWTPATISQAKATQVVTPAKQQNPQHTRPTQTAAPQTVETKEPSAIDMESPEIEALVVARGVGIEVNSSNASTHLDFFSNLTVDTHRILCINPPPSLLPLLQSLAQQERHIICVECKTSQWLKGKGFEAIATELPQWMIATNRSSLREFDTLYLNQDIPAETLILLKGRLSAETKLLVSNNEAAAPNSSEFLSEWGTTDSSIEGFRLYQSPPKDWIDPFWQVPLAENHHRWPWNYPAPTVPATLPSGKPWPKISVVTVSLNQGHYIEETIRSVLLQGYPNLEYIVLDGGSTDQTSAILDRYRHELTYCISEPDEGQSNALNKGFKLATGDILAWLNSDDRYLPDTLFRVAIAFDTYGADMVSGGCQLIEDHKLAPFKTHHSAMPIGNVVPLPLDRLLNLDDCWQKGEFFYQPEVFWTRDLWERSGAGLNEELFYSMDYELWLRMAYQEATIAHIPDPLALYRVHPQQKTYGNDIPYLPELKQVRDQFQNQVLQLKS
ncbi:glycosyltransferase [Oculatella sp. LEGE 06141]|uniref:glycosyltransferase n=1 Tax=Oculatella sp. LEGE 06141 TaxID=1828648 RepID=UPI00187F90E0|nr:glycosyltransferase [Oculatella sp. LEGE 06141]MBE9178293.1 glycosyltransferase [Oculatella sp. LEGE 06141]